MTFYEYLNSDEFQNKVQSIYRLCYLYVLVRELHSFGYISTDDACNLIKNAKVD